MSEVLSASGQTFGTTRRESSYTAELAQQSADRAESGRGEVACLAARRSGRVVCWVGIWSRSSSPNHAPSSHSARATHDPQHNRP
jgi:hypothetical protein